LNANAVSQFGVDLLEAMNGLSLPPTRSRGRLGFADGGLVQASSGGDSFEARTTINHQSLDPRTGKQIMEQYTPVFRKMMVDFFRQTSEGRRAANRG
jgi:hypothetical protein